MNDPELEELVRLPRICRVKRTRTVKGKNGKEEDIIKTVDEEVNEAKFKVELNPFVYEFKSWQ